jgi:hypothetical protein
MFELHRLASLLFLMGFNLFFPVSNIGRVAQIGINFMLVVKVISQG